MNDGRSGLRPVSRREAAAGDLDERHQPRDARDVTETKSRPRSVSAGAGKADERLRSAARTALDRMARALELGRRGRRVREMAKRAASQGSG